MLDAFEVLMPAFKERVRGRLRPVLGASCGALLLDGAAPNGSLVPALYDELELYLQAAGISCLRVSGRPDGSVTRRARELLASVIQLRSIGVERVILVVYSNIPLPSVEHASTDTLVDFLGQVIEQSATMSGMLGAVRSLVASVRVVADSVVGVATLVPAYNGPHIDPVRQRMRRSLRLITPPDFEGSSTAFDGDAAPATPIQSALLLSLRKPTDPQPNQHR